MSQVPSVAVLGDGSWATALIQILTEQDTVNVTHLYLGNNSKSLTLEAN